LKSIHIITILLIATLFSVVGCSVQSVPAASNTYSTQQAADTSATALKHYSDATLGFSFDYPYTWQLQQLGQGELIVKPKDSQINQIQIGAYPDKPTFTTFPNDIRSKMAETSVRQLVDAENGTSLKIIKNHSSGNKWDWEISYSFYKGSNSIIGTQFLRETANVVYYVTIYHSVDSPYTEGYSVITSFKMNK
jgi:hypothetical protein